MSGSVPGAAATAVKKTFDLSKHDNVLALLNYVRQSQLDPDLQNETRNQILDYVANPTNTTFDNLQTLLQPFGVVIIESAIDADSTTKLAEAAPKEASPVLGQSRPKPRFTPVSVKATTVPENTNPTNEEKPEPSVSDQTIPKPQTTPEPAKENNAAVEEPTPTKPTTDPVTEPTATEPAPAAANEPVVTPMEQSEVPAAEDTKEEAVAENPVPEPSSVPASIQTEQETAVTETPAVTTAVSDVEQLNRIKEIKRLVNQKVGNPVNLIDTNNEVGREYMNALLDAMKKVHAGVPGDSVAAMQRLEAAYAEVEKTLAATPVATEQKADTATPAPSPETTQSENEVKESTVVTNAPRPTDTPSPQAPDTNQNPVSKASDTEEVTGTEPVSKMPATEPEIPAAAPAVESAAPISTQPTAQPTSPPDSVSENNPEPAGLRSLAADLAAVPNPHPTTQAAAIPTASMITDQPAPSSSPQTVAPAAAPAPMGAETMPKPAVPGSDLQTPEITNGLSQLLSEWSLFKSSGLFGTGPSGAEHPLYKTLAPLTMAAVVSGRFEGATPEVKQSITDYMNGWRYEQGIIHEMDETFEHYLRRVIKEILDKQPKNP